MTLTEAQRFSKQVSASNKRARDAGLIGDLTSDQWRSTVRAFYGKCAYCGCRLDGKTTGSSIHVSLFVPVAAGGCSTLNNAVPACRTCHRRHPGPEIPPELLARIHAHFETHGAPDVFGAGPVELTHYMDDGVACGATDGKTSGSIAWVNCPECRAAYAL